MPVLWLCALPHSTPKSTSRPGQPIFCLLVRSADALRTSSPNSCILLQVFPFSSRRCPPHVSDARFQTHFTVICAALGTHKALRGTRAIHTVAPKQSGTASPATLHLPCCSPLFPVGLARARYSGKMRLSAWHLPPFSPDRPSTWEGGRVRLVAGGTGWPMGGWWTRLLLLLCGR